MHESKFHEDAFSVDFFILQIIKLKQLFALHLSNIFSRIFIYFVLLLFIIIFILILLILILLYYHYCYYLSSLLSRYL